jgi:hypothetical protein
MGIKVEINYQHNNGRERYVLLENVHITVFGREFIVPAGFETDFMSIPKFLQGFFPLVNKHAPAALLHDYLLHNNVVPESEADLIFRECLKNLGMKVFTRNCYYWSVHLNTITNGFLGKVF